jgi:hypothetical protein
MQDDAECLAISARECEAHFFGKRIANAVGMTFALALDDLRRSSRWRCGLDLLNVKAQHCLRLRGFTPDA